MEKAPKDGWKLKIHSFTVRTYWFKDGNCRTFYSMDWKHIFSTRDRNIGLSNFKKKTLEYGSKIDFAIISENDSDTPSERTPISFNEGGIELNLSPVEIHKRLKFRLAERHRQTK